ncbi:MAG: helix-hairpin-helix domain-containing protein [Candidatus Methanoperedens sp.]|nr:helix-hairpin-helix domain-containing protein [Candidatus Methanoperedens sp.]
MTDHGHRSITGLPAPVDINRLPVKIIQMLPGIGKKQADEIIHGRPFANKEELVNRTSIRGKVLEHIMV